MKLLSPKKFKHKKSHNIFYKTKNFIKLKFITSYTQFLIYSVKTGYLTAKHLETFRLFLRRIFKNGSNLKVIINTFPDLSRTKKSAGLRMGKGKGKPYVWVSKLKKGSSMFEIKNFAKYINYDTEFFNIPVEYENYFKNKSLRNELPFSDRLDLETSYSEMFKLPFINENDNENLIEIFSSMDFVIYNFFLRTNSSFNMEFLVNSYIYKNFCFGSINNKLFQVRDSLVLAKLFNKGLRKFPLKSDFIRLHNRFFLYN